MHTFFFYKPTVEYYKKIKTIMIRIESLHLKENLLLSLYMINLAVSTALKYMTDHITCIKLDE